MSSRPDLSQDSASSANGAGDGQRRVQQRERGSGARMRLATWLQLPRDVYLLLFYTLGKGFQLTIGTLDINYYAHSLGYQPDFIGLLSAMPALGSLVSAVPSGMLADRLAVVLLQAWLPYSLHKRRKRQIGQRTRRRSSFDKEGRSYRSSSTKLMSKRNTPSLSVASDSAPVKRPAS